MQTVLNPYCVLTSFFSASAWQRYRFATSSRHSRGEYALDRVASVSDSFRDVIRAQVTTISVLLVSGFLTVMFVYLVEQQDRNSPIVHHARRCFRPLPSFNLGDSLIQLSRLYWRGDILGEDYNPFDWDVAGESIVALYLSSVPFFLLVLLSNEGCQSKMLRRITSAWDRTILFLYGIRERDEMLVLTDGSQDFENRRDNSVEEEHFHVTRSIESGSNEMSAQFNEVWKVFSPPGSGVLSIVRETLAGISARTFGVLSKSLCCLELNCSPVRLLSIPRRAVRGVSLGVRRDETLALLGTNGSGKSTLLRILSGDTAPTKGLAMVDATSIEGLSRRQVGFCPQQNPLSGRMTGRETLRMHARLRGVPLGSIDDAVDELLNVLSLADADVLVKHYSVGDKRKLTFGTALVGNPKFLLVDEACTGVDLNAQHLLWNLINRISIGRSVLLTTQSVEEAEVLSSRASVMSDGKILCVGAVNSWKVSENPSCHIHSRFC